MECLSTLEIALLTVNIATILTTVILLAFVIKYRKHKVLKACTPPLLYVSVLGGLLSLLAFPLMLATTTPSPPNTAATVPAPPASQLGTGVTTPAAALPLSRDLPEAGTAYPPGLPSLVPAATPAGTASSSQAVTWIPVHPAPTHVNTTTNLTARASSSSSSSSDAIATAVGAGGACTDGVRQATDEASALGLPPGGGVCVLAGWLQHMGFTLLYAALVFKTWRISVIVSCHKTPRLVRVGERAVYRRVTAALTAVIAYLAVWTAVSGGRPCGGFSWWEAVLVGGEVLFLAWGGHLCRLTAPAAPALYNDAAPLSYALWNQALCSLAALIARYCSVAPSGGGGGGPAAAVVTFLAAHCTVPVTLLLVYGPKFSLLLGLSGGGREVAGCVGEPVGAGRRHTVSLQLSRHGRVRTITCRPCGPLFYLEGEEVEEDEEVEGRRDEMEKHYTKSEVDALIELVSKLKAEKETYKKRLRAASGVALPPPTLSASSSFLSPPAGPSPYYPCLVTPGGGCTPVSPTLLLCLSRKASTATTGLSLHSPPELAVEVEGCGGDMDTTENGERREKPQRNSGTIDLSSGNRQIHGSVLNTELGRNTHASYCAVNIGTERGVDTSTVDSGLTVALKSTGVLSSSTGEIKREGIQRKEDSGHEFDIKGGQFDAWCHTHAGHAIHTNSAGAQKCHLQQWNRPCEQLGANFTNNMQTMNSTAIGPVQHRPGTCSNGTKSPDRHCQLRAQTNSNSYNMGEHVNDTVNGSVAQSMHTEVPHHRSSTGQVSAHTMTGESPRGRKVWADCNEVGGGTVPSTVEEDDDDDDEEEEQAGEEDGRLRLATALKTSRPKFLQLKSNRHRHEETVALYI